MAADVDWWRTRSREARKRMSEAPSSRTVLIEVAAQHPLRRDGTPGVEFAARLDRGAELARQRAMTGWTVEIYVPGSRHRDGCVEDPVSLSRAGTTYLRELVSDSVRLRGEDLNEKYLADEGVYGSADECFVSASHFMDAGFQELLSVVSPQQLPRKMLHYIAFGVEPLMFTAPVREPFHDLVFELTDAIPEVLFTDAFARSNSLAARRLRAARRPK